LFLPKYIWILLLLAALSSVLFLFDILTGSVNIPFPDVYKAVFSEEALKPEWKTIITGFRIPKAFTAVLAGLALSVSGLQMQTYFRNPLAGPYVLGISAGASLGVALLVMGISALFESTLMNPVSNWSLVFAAWIGAGLVLILILAVSVRVRDNMTILILGILFGSITIALVSILQYFSNESVLRSFIIWTLGSLGNVTGPQLRIMAISIGIGIMFSVLTIKRLNILQLGENYAITLGVNIPVSRFLIFLSTSILAGTVTAFCGPIGFLGIAVPHITRLVLRTSDHMLLVPGSMLIGTAVMLFSDIVSQLPGYQQVLPINSVTAIIGIPVVIWIITRREKIVAPS